MIKRIFDILRGEKYLLYATKCDGNDISYLFFTQSTNEKQWYYKSNFTKYINDAKKYTKKEVDEAQKNTLLNKYKLF